jgi:hypothetical protein
MWKKVTAWCLKVLPRNTWEERRCGRAYKGIGRCLKYIGVSPWSIISSQRILFWQCVSAPYLTEDEIIRGFKEKNEQVVELAIRRMECSKERVEQSFYLSPLGSGYMFMTWMTQNSMPNISNFVDETFLERHDLLKEEFWQVEVLRILTAWFRFAWAHDVWFRIYDAGSDTVKREILPYVRLTLSQEHVAYILRNKLRLEAAFMTGVNAQVSRDMWEAWFNSLIAKTKLTDGYSAMSSELWQTLNNTNGDWPAKIPREKLFYYFMRLPTRVGELWNECHEAFLEHPMFCPSLDMLEYLKSRVEVDAGRFELGCSQKMEKILMERIPEWELRVEGEKIRLMTGITPEHSRSNRKVL